MMDTPFHDVVSASAPGGDLRSARQEWLVDPAVDETLQYRSGNLGHDRPCRIATMVSVSVAFEGVHAVELNGKWWLASSRRRPNVTCLYYAIRKISFGFGRQRRCRETARTARQAVGDAHLVIPELGRVLRPDGRSVAASRSQAAVPLKDNEFLLFELQHQQQHR
jgi:hypothetical protein